jgi:hypothetical protein
MSPARHRRALVGARSRVDVVGSATSVRTAAEGLHAELGHDHRGHDGLAAARDDGIPMGRPADHRRCADSQAASGDRHGPTFPWSNPDNVGLGDPATRRCARRRARRVCGGDPQANRRARASRRPAGHGPPPSRRSGTGLRDCGVRPTLGHQGLGIRSHVSSMGPSFAAAAMSRYAAPRRAAGTRGSVVPGVRAATNVPQAG